jgi:integrase
MKTGKLSAAKIGKVKAQGLYGDGGNLWLQVGREPHMRSWLFRYTLAGRARAMGLGSASTLSLSEARERAQEARKLLLDGIDPIAHRDGERAQRKLEAANAITFKECAAAYIRSHQAGWSNEKHGAQWESTLAAYVYPAFGDLPVGAIDTGLVMRALTPIWTAKPETASRVRGRIEAVLDAATVQGYRQGDNPARWRGHLEALLPARSKVAAVAHHAALPYREMAAFMVKVREQDGIAPRALEFAVLTACRTGEVLGAKWSEVDWHEALWTIPAARTKSYKVHRVPLAPAALAVLKTMRDRAAGDFVFSARSSAPLNADSALDVLRRMGRADLTVHGFRSSFRDWCAEATGFPHEVCEMSLGHAVASAVERAYRRGDLFEKRRKLMEAWAAYCAASVKGGKVVPLKRASEGL